MQIFFCLFSKLKLQSVHTINYAKINITGFSGCIKTTELGAVLLGKTQLAEIGPRLAFGPLEKLTFFDITSSVGHPQISWLGTFGLLILFLRPQH